MSVFNPGKLQHPGRLQVGQRVVNSQTASYTATPADDVIYMNATGGSLTVTLPSPTAFQQPANIAQENVNNLVPQGTIAIPGKTLTIKKTDTSANVVYIATAGSENVITSGQGYTGANAYPLIAQGDELTVWTDGTNWYVAGPQPGGARLLAAAFSFPLTATGQTPLFTVPTGRTAKITNIIFEGMVAMSGGTSSTLKIGTTANSYAELLTSSGVVFIAGTATSLLAVGARISPWIVTNNVFATMSVAPTGSFAAGSVIQLSVSGTVLTAGKITVELYGYLL